VRSVPAGETLRTRSDSNCLGFNEEEDRLIDRLKRLEVNLQKVRPKWRCAGTHTL
jgi:hypothetical protein